MERKIRMIISSSGKERPYAVAFKSLLLVVLILFYFINTKASYKSEIYQAYIINDMEHWKNVIDEMERQKNKSNAFILELINYQYGYIAWCIGMKKEDQAKKYLSLGEKNVMLLENNGYQLSMVNAYKAAFYGYHIGLSIFQAPFLGPKSMSCAKQAIQLDENNPFGYIQRGNVEYFMPVIFGGSKELGLKYYEKAEKLMENNPEQLKNDWNYLNLLVMIAQGYNELKQYDRTKAYYEKIIRIEPGFLWVKDELYPELMKKLNENR